MLMLVLALAFLVGPFAVIFLAGFSGGESLRFPPESYSWRWMVHVLEVEAFQRSLVTSLWVGFGSTFSALVLGVPVAYALSRFQVPGREWVRTALTLPLVVPGILVAIGVFYAYVQLKLVNSLTGLVLAHSMLAIPVVVLVVSAALKSFDLQQEMVARSLGAPRWQAFWLVTLPQIQFSVVSAAVLAFLTSFDEIIVSLFIAGGDHSTLTRNMFNALRDQIDPTIAAISTLVIALTSLLLVATQLRGAEPGVGGH
jgi:putative spermidine/putrescine transport system permease protein